MDKSLPNGRKLQEELPPFFWSYVLFPFWCISVRDRDSNQGGPKDYSGCPLLHKIWPSGSLSCPTYKPETVLEGLLVSPELQILSHPIISSLVACTKAAFWPCLCLWEGKRNRAACGGCLPLSESSSTAGAFHKLLHELWKKQALRKLDLGCGLKNQALGRTQGNLDSILSLLFTGLDLLLGSLGWVPHLWNEKGICSRYSRPHLFKNYVILF